VLAGIVVLAYPGILLPVLAVVLGVWLIVVGALQNTAAFRIRSLAVHAWEQVPLDGSWHVARACAAGLPAEAALR
jgi:uncharacterized membrane protein HdeD (DUF308 family)